MPNIVGLRETISKLVAENEYCFKQKKIVLVDYLLKPNCWKTLRFFVPK
jgi:hypothetical protein